MLQESCVIVKTRTDFIFALNKEIPIIIMLTGINSNKRQYSSSEATVGNTKVRFKNLWTKGHVKIIFLPIIALSFPFFCPKLEHALHKHQEQHS